MNLKELFMCQYLVAIGGYLVGMCGFLVKALDINC